jgi:hypothetical protein
MRQLKPGDMLTIAARVYAPGKEADEFFPH